MVNTKDLLNALAKQLDVIDVLLREHNSTKNEQIQQSVDILGVKPGQALISWQNQHTDLVDRFDKTLQEIKALK